MDVPFRLEVHPTYLHFKYPSGFVATLESTGEAWITIGELCEQHERSKVLIEATKPERRLDTMSAFESGRLLAENAPGISLAICLHDYQFDELSSFFKTVAQNRGVKIELFTDLGAALRWLDVDTGENAAGSP
jgi:hypothetical protein